MADPRSSSAASTTTPTTPTGKEEEELEEVDSDALSDLLAALASGVRAVQGIPTGDDFEYEKSFPEFSTSWNHCQSIITSTLLRAIRATTSEDEDEVVVAVGGSSNNNAGGGGAGGGGDEQVQYPYPFEDVFYNSDALMYHQNIDDPVLWEKCADACDTLIESVQASTQSLEEGRKGGGGGESGTEITANLQRWSNLARNRSRNSYQLLLEGIADMEKPQIVHSMTGKFQNSRTEPFVPPIDIDGDISNNNGSSKEKLSKLLQPVPGHGLETRYGKLRSNKNYALPPNLVAPTSHVPHPYRERIESFAYDPNQLKATKEEPPSPPKLIPEVPIQELDAVWIDKESDLKELANELNKLVGGGSNENNNESVVAVDLEAHSYRSFAGLTCLMQISFYRRCGNDDNNNNKDKDDHGDNNTNTICNYLIDTLALRDVIGRYLQPCFANPLIVKVMHGADSDVLWMQRDFGLYVVNLFDTGRAARALKFRSAGYAYLLLKYVGISADKQYQLADWRQRPLPAEMRQYAIQDTYYLIDIYERLKWDLSQQQQDSEEVGSSSSLIEQVLDVSRQVCLVRYAVEPFDPDGYKVMQSRSRTTKFNELQSSVLKRLYDWRDKTSRDEDESAQYVCPNKALIRIASSLSSSSPTSLRALQSLLNPVPPLVLSNAQQIIDIIKHEVNNVDKQCSANRKEEDDGGEDGEGGDDNVIAKQPVGAPSSAFFKPAANNNNNNNSKTPAPKDTQQQHQIRSSGMMSPVLGSETLFKLAGWMTPPPSSPKGEKAEAAPTTSTSGTNDEDEDPTSSDQKPKRLLSVHASNKDWRASSKQQQSESGKDEAGTAAGGSSKTVDGMGTVRAEREHSQSPTAASLRSSSTTTVEADAQRAKQSAVQIRNALPSVLGLVTPTIDVTTDDDEVAEDRKVSTPRTEGAAAAAAAGGSSSTQPRDVAAESLMDEEEFPIPRSMREIYKISNRNRRNKKTGSPTPERGVTPTSEAEQKELVEAEALLRDRGLMMASPYFSDSCNPASGKRQRTKTALSGRESEESVPQESYSSAVSRDEDLAVIRAVGWMQQQPAGGLASGATGEAFGGAGAHPGQQQGSTKTTEASYDYSAVGAIGAMDPTALMQQQPHNPFFAGAALAGGAASSATQGQQQRTNRNHRTRQNNRERPEKKDGGRTHSYRRR